MMDAGVEEWRRGMADTLKTGRSRRVEPETTKIDGIPRDSLELAIERLTSPTLRRLVEEVRNETEIGRNYNRSYHRHNR